MITNMDFDVESLRQLEAACIEKLSRKARALREADPGLNPGLARAKACQLLHRTTAAYLDCTQRLTYAGHQPRVWK
jgi:hypothetical protein